MDEQEMKALQRAAIIQLTEDFREALESGDRTKADRILETWRGLLCSANSWDELVRLKQRPIRDLTKTPMKLSTFVRAVVGVRNPKAARQMINSIQEAVRDGHTALPQKVNEDYWSKGPVHRFYYRDLKDAWPDWCELVDLPPLPF